MCLHAGPVRLGRKGREEEARRAVDGGTGEATGEAEAGTGDIQIVKLVYCSPY